jgi:hypothetical protein
MIAGLAKPIPRHLVYSGADDECGSIACCSAGLGRLGIFTDSATMTR